VLCSWWSVYRWLVSGGRCARRGRQTISKTCSYIAAPKLRHVNGPQTETFFQRLLRPAGFDGRGLERPTDACAAPANAAAHAAARTGRLISVVLVIIVFCFSTQNTKTHVQKRRSARRCVVSQRGAMHAWHHAATARTGVSPSVARCRFACRFAVNFLLSCLLFIVIVVYCYCSTLPNVL